MSSEINCQNLEIKLTEIITQLITGIRPSSSGGFDHYNGSHNGHNDQVSSPSSYILSGIQPQVPIHKFFKNKM
jgi:hypothetical protein